MFPFLSCFAAPVGFVYGRLEHYLSIFVLDKANFLTSLCISEYFSCKWFVEVFPCFEDKCITLSLVKEKEPQLSCGFGAPLVGKMKW